MSLKQSLDIDVENALENIRNIFSGPENTEELFHCVSEFLPLETDSYKIKSVTGKTSCFKADAIQCEIKSENDITNFVDSYMKRSNETLRKSTPRIPGKRDIYEKIYYYRCHFKTKHQPTMNHEQVIKAKPKIDNK